MIRMISSGGRLIGILFSFLASVLYLFGSTYVLERLAAPWTSTPFVVATVLAIDLTLFPLVCRTGLAAFRTRPLLPWTNIPPSILVVDWNISWH